MSSNIQRFQLTQGGKNYILTSQIDGEFVKITCVESNVENSPMYIGRFALSQLQQLNKRFNKMTTIKEAQEFLNQSIEKQKVNVEYKGNLLNVTLYFLGVSSQTGQIINTEYNTQAINYETQPITYNAVEEQQYFNLPVTTTTTETVENNINYIPDTTNYNFVEDNNTYINGTENQTYENYDYNNTANYQNYQTYENINIDTNPNYDYNLNNAVEINKTEMNTYTTTIQTPKIEEMETLTLPLALNLQPQIQAPKVDNSKYLAEIEELKNQIKILKEENTILKTKTVEKTIVKTIDNSAEILLLKQEIERLKKQLEQYINIKITFENYKIQKEKEISELKLKIEELKTKLSRFLEEKSYSESLIKRQQNSSSNERQTLSIQDMRLEVIKGDIIQNASELELLTRRICKHYNKIILNLLYKATADSDKASVFHNKCDSAENTLVLVKSSNGKRFGGYTSCSWEGDSIEKKDENAFVFSLDKMKIYNIIPGEGAIGCYPKFGPVFLGCQIRIYDHAFKNGGTTFEKELNFNTDYIYVVSNEIETCYSDAYGCELPVIPNNGILLEAITYYCMYKMLTRGYKHPVMNLAASQYGTNPYYLWTTLKEKAKASVTIDSQKDNGKDSAAWQSYFYNATFPTK